MGFQKRILLILGIISLYGCQEIKDVTKRNQDRGQGANEESADASAETGEQADGEDAVEGADPAVDPNATPAVPVAAALTVSDSTKCAGYKSARIENTDLAIELDNFGGKAVAGQASIDCLVMVKIKVPAKHSLDATSKRADPFMLRTILGPQDNVFITTSASLNIAQLEPKGRIVASRAATIEGPSNPNTPSSQLLGPSTATGTANCEAEAKEYEVAVSISILMGIGGNSRQPPETYLSGFFPSTQFTLSPCEPS